jgi:hypothetical protein
MAKGNSQEQRTLGILTHLLGLFTSFIGPLVILLVSEDKKVKKYSKLALNWQISLIIYAIISTILSFILIGIPLLIIISILQIVFPIIASVRASEDTFWKYPITIEFFKVKI